MGLNINAKPGWIDATHTLSYVYGWETELYYFTQIKAISQAS